MGVNCRRSSKGGVRDHGTTDGRGALLRDLDDRVLLVEPTYKPYREIPSSPVDRRGTPARELREELDLDVGRPLVFDWLSAEPERPDGWMIVFDAGRLTNDITLRDEH